MDKNIDCSCHCSIKKLASFDQLSALSGLFDSVGMKKIEFDKLAEIDMGKPRGLSDCPFLYSWGFTYYCNNPERIQEFLNSQETPSS